MAKRTKTIYKALYRKLKIKQCEPRGELRKGKITFIRYAQTQKIGKSANPTKNWGELQKGKIAFIRYAQTPEG